MNCVNISGFIVNLSFQFQIAFCFVGQFDLLKTSNVTYINVVGNLF